jgi:hypothetical protein
MREDRDILASEQAALVSALHGIGQPPSGFDTDHLNTAADSLARKRARSVQKTWPATGEALGRNFGRIFQSYCAEHPAPDENPFEDGYRFAMWLERKRILPQEGRLELARQRVARSGVPRILYQITHRKILFLFRTREGVRTFHVRLSLNPARLFE